jgi:hypothetical protein
MFLLYRYVIATLHSDDVQICYKKIRNYRELMEMFQIAINKLFE